MTPSVRIGIVGTSWWTDMMFAPALQSHPQAELAAICGRNQGRAAEMAAKYSIPQVYDDYREMMAHGGLDAVIVATPDDLHHEITLHALGAGLHVLCEKPLALTAQQAWEMYEKAEAAKVKHMVLFTWRWMPFFQYARDLVDQGFIGRCFHCEFHFLGGDARSPEYQWHFDQDRALGTLGNLGSHVIDLARWMLGDIVKVNAELGVSVVRRGAEGGPIDPANDSAQLLVEFASGAHGLIQASAVAHVADRVFQQHIRLYGEAGSLEITFYPFGTEAGATIRAARSSETTFQTLVVPDSYWVDASRADLFGIFTTQAVGSRLFVEAILENRPVTPSFYDGYKAQQVVDAALESHRSGRAVTIVNRPPG
ncbi:MAG: Gfo/Idh/MocA family oxidoreductase [Anaerolineales bacterium]